MYTIIDYYIVAYTVMGIYIALKTRTPKSWSHMTVLTLKLVLFLSSWLYPATISEFSGGVTQRLFAVPFFHEKSIRSDGSGIHAHTLMQYPLLSHQPMAIKIQHRDCVETVSQWYSTVTFHNPCPLASGKHSLYLNNFEIHHTLCYPLCSPKSQMLSKYY